MERRIENNMNESFTYLDEETTITRSGFLEQLQKIIHEEEPKCEERQRNYEERIRETEEQRYIQHVKEIYNSEFWFFMVEETIHDSFIAYNLRTKEENIWRFRNYLLEKYWINWLNDSEGTEDDCVALLKMRMSEKINKQMDDIQQDTNIFESDFQTDMETYWNAIPCHLLPSTKPPLTKRKVEPNFN